MHVGSEHLNLYFLKKTLSVPLAVLGQGYRDVHIPDTRKAPGVVFGEEILQAEGRKAAILPPPKMF